MKIVILSGGLSNEREVSINSSKKIETALKENGHKVINIDLSTDVINPQDTFLKEIIQNNNQSTIGKNVIEVCKKADIVFIGLHGSIGEDGKLQALLDLNNIKYTGSGFSGSNLAMDKYLAKLIASCNKVPTPNFIIFDNNKEEIINQIKFPMVIKPAKSGSSVGVSIIENEETFENAVNEALKWDSTIIVEEFIKSRELSVGIIGKEVLPPIEIITHNGFYNYENKYIPGRATEICPAKISEKITELMQKYAKKMHNALNLEVYSRIDFLLRDDELFFLEANSLPGMTNTSLLPQEALAIGINFNELCEKIIALSLNK